MATQPTTDSVLSGLKVRTFRPEDQEAVSRLYTDGLLAGQIAPNDTGADIENIRAAYFEDERSHFWVAEAEGQVLGMIGAAREDDNLAEIRRLRVEPRWQHAAIAGKLVEVALEHCRRHGYLKIVLDTRFDPDAVVDLFDRFGFQHTRTKPAAGKELLEFYLDLYRPRKERDERRATSEER